MSGIMSLRIPIFEKHMMLSICKTILEITPPGVSQKSAHSQPTEMVWSESKPTLAAGEMMNDGTHGAMIYLRSNWRQYHVGSKANG